MNYPGHQHYPPQQPKPPSGATAIVAGVLAVLGGLWGVVGVIAYVAAVLNADESMLLWSIATLVLVLVPPTARWLGWSAPVSPQPYGYPPQRQGW